MPLSYCRSFKKSVVCGRKSKCTTWLNVTNTHSHKMYVEKILFDCSQSWCLHKRISARAANSEICVMSVKHHAFARKLVQIRGVHKLPEQQSDVKINFNPKRNSYRDAKSLTNNPTVLPVSDIQLRAKIVRNKEEDGTGLSTSSNHGTGWKWHGNYRQCYRAIYMGCVKQHGWRQSEVNCRVHYSGWIRLVPWIMRVCQCSWFCVVHQGYVPFRYFDQSYATKCVHSYRDHADKFENQWSVQRGEEISDTQ